MTTESDKGTVKGRPDDAMRYLVEVPGLGNEAGDPDGKWVYHDSYYDTQEQAVRAAEAVTGPVRVRAFRVTHMPADHAIVPSVYSAKPVSGAEVSLVELTCITHREWVIRVPESGHARCPHCNAEAVTPAFAAATRKPTRDWSKK